MPLYTDGNFYYSGGSSQLYSPYYPTGLYSTPNALPGSSGGYSPYSSTYNRTIGGTYVVPLTPPRSPSSYTNTHSLSSRYQPKLNTIIESKPFIGSARHALTPLTRIQSPKYTSYSNPTTSSSNYNSPKYIPPRPIHINTADIDVSYSRYGKRKDSSKEDAPRKKVEAESTKTPSQSPPPSGSTKKRGSKEKDKSKNETDATIDERRAARSRISRNRPVVRLSTIRTKSKDRSNAGNAQIEPSDSIFRDLPHPEIATATAENLTWRQKLAEDLATIPVYPIKKSPGDIIRERYFIQDNKSEVAATTKSTKSSGDPKIKLIPQVIDEVVVDIDPLHHTIRRLSLPKCPTFHDICEDISSDKIDDDLNAGELRRRVSLIQEQEQEIFNQLQKSASGTFQLIHLERRGSHDSVSDEAHVLGSKRKSHKSKKIRHKITAFVDVENPTIVPVMPILIEKEEEAITPNTREARPSPKFTCNVESVEEHAEMNQVFKLPKKKSVKKAQKPKEVALPEGFVTPPPKVERNEATENVSEKQKTFVSTAEIFTFSQQSIDASKNEETKAYESMWTEPELPKQIPEKQAIETKKAVKSSRAKVSHITPPKVKNAILSNLKEAERKTKTPSPTAIKKVFKTKETLEHKQAIKASVSLDVETKKPIHAVSSVLEKSQSLQTEPPIKVTLSESPLIQTPKQATITTTLQSSISLDASGVTAKNDQAKQLDKAQSLNAEDIQPGFATPKPIRKAKPKSDVEVGNNDDDDDFWSKIGTRETIYMSNRKKSLHEIQWQRFEEEDAPIAKTELGNESQVKEALVDPVKIVTTAPEQLEKLKMKGEINSTSTTKETESPTTSQKKCIETSTPTVAKSTENSTSIENKSTAATTSGTTTVPTATTATAKINTGQAAKSPEQQTKPKAASNELSPQAKQDKTLINNAAATSAKTTDTSSATVTKTTKPTTAIKTTTTTPKDTVVPTVEKRLQPEVTTKVNKVTEDAANTQKQRTSDPKSPTATETKSTSVNENTKLPLGKPKVVAKVSPPSTASTPINADHFTTKAPPPATSNQIKNVAATAAATTSPTSAVKKTDKKSSSPAKKVEPPAAKPAIAAVKEAPKTTTATADVPPATTTTPNAAATAKAKISEDEHATSACGTSESGSNLAKFATVTNLAQCLQDVDADLEDYIFSSAEEYDEDESNLSDISLPAGCEHLSENMKKKLKQKKKKEREAEKARFDPQKKIKIDLTNKCYVKEEAPRFPLIATPRPLWRREKVEYPDEDTESESESDSGSTEETTEDSEECTTSEEYEDDLATTSAGAAGGDIKDNSSIIRMSTCSNDSGFEGGTAPSSPKKMLECDTNCHKKCERLTANLCGVNQKLIVEALANVKRGARETRESPSTPPSLNPAYKIDVNVEEADETSCTYTEFQKSGRFTAPATVIPRFKNYCVDDFHFLAVLGKGSFGKVLLAELRDTTYYYAVKCLKKDVVLEDDDVDSTLIERKVLALGTKHPYLCHLFCTFQTESHLFFVMEYLNGGDLMFHIQESGRFTEERARFYGAEIISGLKFLHKKGIIYRDLKLDNVLLDYEGHVRIADFGMCKLQIYLDKTADSFCGTPDYMAPEIVKGEKYNQNVDWWSFGVLLYEMLIGQSPFSGCDEDELFWSICNEIPWFPVYISAEAMSILKGLLEKDYTKRIGSQYSPAGDVSEHVFFRPIDWDLLEKRQLQPPFRPQVKHPLDTQYFDRVFTKERVRLTPIDKDILQSMDQKQFHGFTYTNPHITLD